MQVVDQDTSKPFILHRTPELVADLDPIDTPCEHIKRELRQRKNKAGATQYIEQCLRCGESVGLFRKHTPELVALPIWDDQLEDTYIATRKRNRAAVQQKHVRIQRSKSDGFWGEYNLYLESDEWRQKRLKVMQRANGQCEGCGTKPATQVHHLTYKHIFAEFLFELVAVCDDCHLRLHDDGPPIEPPTSAPSEYPCSECVYREDFKGAGDDWCSQFDKPSKDVLADDGGECVSFESKYAK